MYKRPGDEFTLAGAVVPVKKSRSELVQAVDPVKGRALVEHTVSIKVNYFLYCF